MTKEELKQKCTERAKIFQQAMESYHSSSPMDCIEWFADRIAELEKENAELKEQLGDKVMQKQKDKADLVWKLKTANEQKADQLTKAKKIIKALLRLWNNVMTEETVKALIAQAEQFLNSEVEK